MKWMGHLLRVGAMVFDRVMRPPTVGSKSDKTRFLHRLASGKTRLVGGHEPESRISEPYKKIKREQTSHGNQDPLSTHT
jgi:hypothetical protein